MYKVIKRFFDFSLSLLAIIVLSPIFLIVTVLVALFIGFPVLFKQPRPGKNGKLFMLYKFRSMTNKKDKNGDLLPDNQRITMFGKFLRVSSLDELPQLFNILKGDMSIIGPRPKLVKDVIFYDETNKSLDIRPGITGLAQVNGRNNITWDSVFEFNKKYVEECSFKMDFKIFLKTFGTVFGRTGTYSGENISQDYYYCDYLLRMDKITQEEYNQKLTHAKRIEFAFKQTRTALPKQTFAPQEDFDWEHKHTD